MGKSKTLILIDGHALAFREYYALERTNMKTSTGLTTWGVFGFFKAIFDLLKNPKLKADAIAVAFDVSHQTFRTEKYEKYKSNRVAMPDPMREQMQLIYEGLKAFNIPIYTKEGFEADDVIGTISKKACELGHKIYILTGDQDAFQLVDQNECVTVIIPSKGDLIEYNWEKVYDKLGVYPNQIIDYKALRGDTSDCIPGIRGIGEKTAQKLLSRYQTLEGVLQHKDEIPEKSLREKVCSGVEEAKLSQYLATIIRNLDINFDFDNTVIEMPEVTKVTEFLTKMQFYSFIKNINSILKYFNKNSENRTDKNIALQPQKQTPDQLSLFAQAVQAEINKSETVNYTKTLLENPTELKSFLNEVKKHNCITFDLKADISSAISSDLVGIAFATSKNAQFKDNKLSIENISNCETCYIPINKENINDIKPILEDDNIKKITHDLKTAINVLRTQNIELKGVIFDTMLASYIKNPATNHEIGIQSIEHLSHAICEHAPFEKNKKKTVKFKDTSIEKIFNHSCDEVAVIFHLAEFWLRTLKPEEINILNEIEIPTAAVLAEMEYTGVSIDVKYLKEFSQDLELKLNQLEENIFQISNCDFNINSPQQVGKILFETLKIETKKKHKGKYSTNADVLEELAQKHEIAKLLLSYRKFKKLKSTYTDALPALIDKDGRIHTTYNQTNTATGRLSSSNPNLQNIPVRTEEGSKMRAAFVPEDRENAVILSADYSQIELRILAHITEDKHLIDAFKNGVDVHTMTASKIFEIPQDEVSHTMRSKAKAVNFGIIYGQSKFGLAKAVGISTQEAGDFIDKYFATYPKIKAYMEAEIKQAELHGYVETVFGRKRYLKEIESPSAMIREFAKRAAINQPIQGTSADLIKIAMIDFSKKLKENHLKSKLIIQVHDELVVETLKSELEQVKKLIKDAMELNQPLRVPLVVDINTGETWKES